MSSRLKPTALLLPVALTLYACGSNDAGSARWLGTTFLLDIPPTHWSEPRGIGGDVGDFVPQFLIGVDKGSADELAITLGTAIDGVQDQCSPTTEVAASGANYPLIKIIAPAFPLRIAHPNGKIVVNTTIRDLSLSDVLPGSMPAEEGQLTATVDVSEVYPLFTLIPNVTKDAVCTQLAAFEAPCATCAFGGQTYCLTLQAVELGAVEATTPVQRISVDQIPGSCSP